MSFKFAIQEIKKEDIHEDNDCIIFDNRLSDDFYIILSPCKLQDNEELYKIFPNNIIRNSLFLFMTTYVQDNIPTKNILESLRKKETDWKKYLKDLKKPVRIFTIGQAMYLLNNSSELNYSHFMENITNKTYYYYTDPDTKYHGNITGWVFPLPNYNELKRERVTLMEKGKSIGTYYNQFIEYQFDKIQNPSLLTDKPDERDYNIKVIDTKEALGEVLSFPWDYKRVAIDTETNGLRKHIDKPFCLTFCPDGITGYYVPIEFITQYNDLFLDFFKRFKMIVAHNAIFDFVMLHSLNLLKTLYPTSDTEVKVHILNTTCLNGLKPSAFRYTKFGGYDEELESYKKKTGISNYALIPKHIMVPYACLDVIVDWRLDEKLEAHINFIDREFPNPYVKEYTLRRLFYKYIMPVYNLYIDVEERGCYVSEERRQLAEDKLKGMINDEVKILQEQFNYPADLNIGSSIQLGKFLEHERKLPLPPSGRSALGGYKTNDEALVFWKQSGYKEVEHIEKVRSLLTLFNTYVGEEEDKSNLIFEDEENNEDKERGWVQCFVKHTDGSTRMHADYRIALANTLRFICKNPNLLNVPSHGSTAKIVKSILSSPDETKYKLATYDCGSLQMVLASRDTAYNPKVGLDETLYGIYKRGSDSGRDMHSITAYNVFAKGFKTQVLDVEDDKGNKYVFDLEQEITVLRNGKNVNILVKDLQVTDDIIVEKGD